MTISEISGTTVFLTNIPDIRLGEAESMAVAVSVGQDECFRETIYCEADGFCWLRSVPDLLRPYLSAGMEEVEITAGLEVYYINVFYCLAFMDNLVGSVDEWLRDHFLTTSEAKHTTRKSKERLAIYAKDNVHVSYQALYRLADGSFSTVEDYFSSDHTIYTAGDITCYDFSPSVIDEETSTDGQLLGYLITVENRTMRFLVDPTVDDTQVAEFVFLNAFGVEEDLSLVGTLESPRQIDYTTVFLQGMRRMLAPELQVPYKLTTALLTNDEVAVLTEMLASGSVWFGNTPSDRTLVNYAGDLTFVPTSEPGKAARAEFSFGYAFHNRRGLDSRIFDDTFDNTHN